MEDQTERLELGNLPKVWQSTTAAAGIEIHISKPCLLKILAFLTVLSLVCIHGEAQSISLPLCHMYLSCQEFLFKEPRTALQLQLSLYYSCFQWGNLGSIFFFFCHEFYSHKLNLQKSNICGAKPYSLFLCMETEAQEKQDWTSSKCSCPIPCKRRSIYVLRWSCCQVLLKLATCFFLQTISLPPLPHLVCLSPISYIVLLIDVLGYCHYINSTKNVHNYKCLCMCIYLHACNALVWIAVVFPVRVKLSWPRTCCCSVWGGKQQLQGWVMKVLVDG